MCFFNKFILRTVSLRIESRSIAVVNESLIGAIVRKISIGSVDKKF